MNVEIRPLEKSDALTSYKWRNNPKIWQYTGSRPDKVITPEMELDWIKKILKKTDQKRFAIIVNAEYVGNTYLTDIHQGLAYFHIFIGEENWWGKGVATEVLKLIFSYAKNILHLNKIYLNATIQNIAAIRLYQKNGFVQTGQNGNRVSMEKIL